MKEKKAPIAYMFEPGTGIYSGSCEACKNPVREDDFIFPGHSTDKKPPKVKANQCAVFDGSAWSVTDDFRGVHYWMPDGQEFVMMVAGVPLPVGHLLERPEPEPEPEPVVSNTDILAARARAYSDPVTGSDRLFAEALRMQAMGEIGFEDVRDRAVSRYEEIKSEFQKI